MKRRAKEHAETGPETTHTPAAYFRALFIGPMARKKAKSPFARIRFCYHAAAPLLLPHPRPGAAPGDEHGLGAVRELRASEAVLNASAIVEAGKPELLRGAWAPASAPDWNWANLRSLLRGHTFRDVYLNDDFHYAPADTKAGLYPFVRHRVARLMNAPRNRSAEEVLEGLAAMERISNRRGLNETGVDVAARRRAFWRSTPSAASRCEQPCAQRQADKVEEEQQQEEEKEARPFGGRHLVWFGDVPAPLRAVLPPPTHPTGARIYASALDASAGLQSAWLSSPGARTHTHYDNDRNFFVQLIGRKRFVLWPPNQTQALCAYPRLHPLWHKSRVVFEAPDARSGTACERYGETSALSVDVGPGDVLYIPPFY